MDAIEAARQFCEKQVDAKACAWCHHPDVPVRSGGLCAHCYRIRRTRDRLASQVEEYKRRGGGHPRVGPVPIEVDYEYRLCLRMEKDAKLEGRTFGDVFARKTTGKDVENLFAGLGASFLRDKSLFKGNGECIEEAFSEEQRRIIYWIAGRLARGYLRKTRRNRKRYDAGDE